MQELLHAYHQLVLILTGLALTVGLISRKKALHTVKHTVLMMLAVPLVLAAVSATWAATPVPTRFVLLAVGLPLAALAALVGTGFGREVLASILGNALYDSARRPGCLPRLALLLLGLAAVLAVFS